MKGSFSALELVCYSFVACKRQVSAQLWFDLSKEYEAAFRISSKDGIPRVPSAGSSLVCFCLGKQQIGKSSEI